MSLVGEGGDERTLCLLRRGGGVAARVVEVVADAAGGREGEVGGGLGTSCHLEGLGLSGGGDDPRGCLCGRVCGGEGFWVLGERWESVYD